MGYLDAHVDGTGLDETLENKQAKTYTVVGFYDRLGYALYSGVGPVAITAESSTPALAAFAEVYLTLSDVQNTEEVQDKAEALFPDDRVELHNGLLRYMGISSDTSIWDNLLRFGAHSLYRNHSGVHLAHLQRFRYIGCGTKEPVRFALFSRSSAASTPSCGHP